MVRRLATLCAKNWPLSAWLAGKVDDELGVDNGLSASGDRKEQAAVQTSYFSGRNSSATASCSGTSGKKLSRWQ